MSLSTRLLSKADVPFAVSLLRSEGWGFEAADIERLLGLGGGIVADVAGMPVGILTITMYQKVAWIGNVAVAPEARGAGAGAAMVRAALARAKERGIESVGLYSVLRAQSLYAREGFQPRGMAYSLHAPTRTGVRPQEVATFTHARLKSVARFDAGLFGDDRGRLLATLVDAFPHSSFVLTKGNKVRGYVIAKPGATGGEIGPLVTAEGDREAIELLVDAALSALPAGTVEAGVREENGVAREVLATRGFAEAFPARVMIWGASGHEGTPSAIACVGGMEKG